MIGHRGVRRAALLTAAAALITGGTTLFTPAAMAQEQSTTITFEEVTAAPTAGTLDNQVSFEIDAGWGTGSVWTLPNDGTPVNYLFDRPVDVRFGVTGLNADGEAIELPEGVMLDELAVNHTWDPGTRTVAGPDGTGTDVSTFTLSSTTDLTVVAVGSPVDDRALGFVDVTYNLPEARIITPSQGQTLQAGEGHTFQYSCTDGTGRVTSSTATFGGDETHSGDPIENGYPLSVREYPGTYYGSGSLMRIYVTCEDEYGATHQDMSRYSVAYHTPTCHEEYWSPVTRRWQIRTEDGLMVLETPYLDLTHPQEPGSPPPPVELPNVHGVSDTVHTYVEPLVDETVVHELNCDLIVPIEDVVDHVAIPVVVQVGKLLGGLFR